MKALCWHGKTDVRVDTVPDPKIISQTDAIVKVTSSAICGSDLHLYGGFMPTMESGDVLGHEFMGEVVETGREVSNVKKGDRVVIPFPIACGKCFFCKKGLFSVCENTNPNAWLSEKMMGHALCGIFGYSHMLGGYAGGQAQYVRVPHVDTNHIKAPEELTDDQVLFLSDIFPTAYMGAEMCNIQGGDTIAIWGCGPVGLLAMKSAFMLGAERVIAIDRFGYRLQMAQRAGAETIDYEEKNTLEALKEMTGGRGPDACIDCVGMEAHIAGPLYAYDRAKQMTMMEMDRPMVVREAIMACRNGGTVSLVGVYGGFVDKFPLGQFMNRSLTLRGGQCHVQRYMKPLLERIRNGEIDPSFIITHHLPLSDAPEAYKMFRDKKDNCEKVVLKPN